MKIFTLTLSSADVFQILDALETRADAWEKTADSSSGEIETEDIFVPEECDDANEAEEIAQHFRDIAETIKKQIEGQRS